MGTDSKGIPNPVSRIPSTRHGLVLVSGAYRGKNFLHVAYNIWQARKVSRFLWDNGVPNICPHLNSALMPEKDDRFLHGYLEMVHRVDALVMVPGWEGSLGAVQEFLLAQNLRLPTFINALDSCVEWHRERMKGLACHASE